VNFFGGSDPGVTGAIAWINAKQPSWVVVRDLPVKKEGSRVILDTRELWEWMRGFPHTRYGLEATQKRPGQDVNKVVAYQYIAGMIHGALGQCELVEPVTWKKALGVSGKKRESVDKALELYPSLRDTDQVTLVKHHNRAEAVLIAHYVKEKFG
jgi:hypothetical protein